MKQNQLLRFIIIVGLFNSISSEAQNLWSLKRCVDTACQKNITVQQIQLNSQINRVNWTQAKAATLPNLNLSDAHNFSSGYSLDPYTYQYTTQNISINNLALNSSLTLFNGELLLNTVRQNKLQYEASVWTIEKAKNDIRLNVMAAYMQILMDYEAIEVASAQLAATVQQVDRTDKMVTYGKLPEANLLQVRSQQASDELTKINAENQLQLDKVMLLQLMQMPVTNDFDIERTKLQQLFPETPLPAEEITRISESFLPQIKSASLTTQSARYSLKMAKSAGLPKLSLTGALKTGYSSLRSNITQNTTYQSQTIGYLNNDITQPVIGSVAVTTLQKENQPLSDQLKNNFSQVVGLSLSVPLFNNYQARSSVAIARINLLNAKLNEQQTKNDLRKAIETAHTNQVSAEKKWRATDSQMQLEKKIYQDMENKYNAGAIDATSYLIEKNNYNKVSMSLIQASYDYVLKSKIIDFYLGKPFID
ncbi:MAG: hypothetical protein JWO58_1601 [Chitinophagaceae bacterium]|nr:hypothetical protein [Chitinophagaceae bacterium]